PNQRGATVSELLQRNNTSVNVGVLLHDTGVAGHLSVPELLASRRDEVVCTPLSEALLPGGPIVRVMTSGSTGQSVPWDKSAEQLLGEVQVLAETFAIGAGTVHAVTVPP